jgi:putative MATE family efflux protein
MNRNLTDGPIARNVTLFAIPLLLASLTQLLYATVDSLFAGNVLGATGMAAIGSSALVVACLISFFSGLSVGANVAVARSFGADDPASVARHLHTALGLALVLGVLLGVVGYLLAPHFVQAMHVPDGIFADSTSYLSIYFLSLPFVVTYSMASAALRGLGDSRTPLLVQIVGGLTNVIADAALLLVVPCGVVGIAWATFASQGVAAALSLWKLSRLDERCRLRLSSLRIDRSSAAAIVRVGLPAALQGIAITFTNLAIQFVINGFGTTSIAAFNAYFCIEILVYQPAIALGQATTVFTAQNLGASKHQRIHAGVRVCLGIAIASTLATSFALLALSPWVCGAFVDDPAVVELGCLIISTTFPLYWLYAFVEVFAGASRGAGRSVPPMAIVLAVFVVGRLALLFLSPLPSFGVQGVAMVFPITWALAALGMWGNYHFRIHPLMHERLPESERYHPHRADL